MFKVLKVSQEKISDKFIKSVEERVTSILQHTHVKKKDVYNSLIKTFMKDKDFRLGSWSKEEMQRARKLVEDKYKKEEWIFNR